LIMPLMHGSSKKAFSHNVRTEMEHGKPQKQAVAIAYRQAREKADGGKVMCAHGGPMKCDMGCYAEGGEVGEFSRPKTETGYEKGVHTANGPGKHARGTSDAGADARMSHMTGDAMAMNDAKMMHKAKLGEMQSMNKPNLYAKGGDVKKLHSEMTMGGHSGTPMSADPAMEEDTLMGESERGMARMPGMPKPNLMAEGGEPDGDEMDSMGDDGLMDQVCDECMEALHNKDRDAFKDALLALVADCLMKMKED
jgi:hypothetical protein